MKKNTILPMNVNPGFLPMEFVQCLAETYRSMSTLLPIQMETSAIPNRARTKNGLAFLASEAEWALLLDSDMVWEPHAVHRLYKTAKETGAKVVSGFTFMEQANRIIPHAYDWVPHKDGKILAPYALIPSLIQPFKVTAVGGACLLVHREVYLQVKQDTQDKTGFYWQEDEYIKGQGMQGEDITFSKRVGDSGFDIIYEPRAFFGHKKKSEIMTTQDYAAFLDSQGISHPFKGL